MEVYVLLNQLTKQVESITLDNEYLSLTKYLLLWVLFKKWRLE